MEMKGIYESGVLIEFLIIFGPSRLDVGPLETLAHGVSRYKAH